MEMMKIIKICIIDFQKLIFSKLDLSITFKMSHYIFFDFHYKITKKINFQHMKINLNLY